MNDLEKLAAIKAAIVPGCCHVSGMHDPVHFRENKYICDKQKADAWLRVCEILGVEYTPQDAQPNPGCLDTGWCNYHKETGGKVAV